MNTLTPKLICLLLSTLYVGSAHAELWETGNPKLAVNYSSHLIVVTNVANGEPYKTSVQVGGYAVSGLASIDSLCREYKVTEIEPFYRGRLRKVKLLSEVSRIYVFYLAGDIDPASILDAFNEDPNIESAELYYRPEFLYEPNDPFLDQQWHMGIIQAQRAWDIIRGEATRHSVVGIVDTGVNWNHPDLFDNIWINTLEDINGNGIFDENDLNFIDDDENGFVDDVVGWDLDDSDNDPSEDYSSHGTGVAGCASEVTDNGILGAGIGYSARIMCVKATPWLSNMDIAYQGLIYAADNGADVINCSWATDMYEQYQQNIVNAIWEEDVLIVAGAGNRGSDELMYPAAYENVMSVAGTEQNDHKADFSSYGTWVDISAPAVDIWRPCYEDDFQPGSGTSYASPIAAGLAALLRANFPDYSNYQIELIIEDAADPIDHLNPGYEGLLGAGRINAAAGVMTAIESVSRPPSRFVFLQNYPNPFNSAATISYNLPESGEITLSVFNLLGQRVATVYKAMQEAGEHKVVWDATDFPSGVYFARLEAAGRSETVKMVLLK